jgi:UDP-N-acetylglucosamine 2-epimerase (non-hydrolysing)
MAPLVSQLERDTKLESLVCVTGQHSSMLKQVLDRFDIEPDYNLAVMTSNQTLNSLTAPLVSALDEVLMVSRPDRVLVHGDTTTAAAAALAAFHRRIPVAHVEAGMRTGNLMQPRPGEMNRRVVDAMSNLMFAPAWRSKSNFDREHLQGRIVVTGNTVIDALLATSRRINGDAELRVALDMQLPLLDEAMPLLIVTGPRRESFGDGFARICSALNDLARSENVQIVYPMHLNPNVRAPVQASLAGVPHVHLIEPLNYPGFVRLMQRASIILTDFGGVQEEAPALGKPVLVMRENAERPEAVDAGTVRLVGTSRASVRDAVLACLEWFGDSRVRMLRNPYGDGRASERIVAALAGRPFVEFGMEELSGSEAHRESMTSQRGVGGGGGAPPPRGRNHRKIEAAHARRT